MHMADLGDIALHWREDGDPQGAPVVFAHALGTDLRIWDTVVAELPQSYRLVRYDMRGHGLSDCPPAPYTMGTLVRDAERLMDHLELRDAVFVGLSVGGMIAQGLAVKRLDLIRALVLSNTAAKIGTAETWQNRIAAVRAGGTASLVDGIMKTWFTPAFRATPEVAAWRNMVCATPQEGYVGTCHAIAGTDFYTPTSGLRLPTLAIAGAEDGSTPPDLVRETADLVHGSRFHLIRRAGHLPCVEQPQAYAMQLTEFLGSIGHGR